MAKQTTPTYFKTTSGDYYTGVNQKVTDNNTLSSLNSGKTPFSTVQKGMEGQFTDPNFFPKKSESQLRREQLDQNTPSMTSIPSPTPAPTPTSAPTPPTPKAPAVLDSYFTSSTENVANTRKSLEDSYKEQIKNIETQKAEAQKNYDDLNNKQEVLLDTNVKPLLEPFRQKLETTDRERLYVNENFEANQSLVRELESLLTEGNNLIKSQKSQPLVLGVLNKKVAKTMADVSARVGVIESVMSARSGQIAEAYRLIDRSVDAITADRSDELDYYKTIYDFYEGQKDTEGNKVLNLDKDQAEFVKARIGLLENDLNEAQKSADYLKTLMTDPDSALFIAKAGVTLNDTPEEINKKMSAQAERDSITDAKNEMALKGYKYVPFANSDDKDIITVDVGGKTLSFKSPTKKTSSSDLTVTLTPENKRDLAGSGLSSNDIDDVQKSVNDFGIKATLEAIDNVEQRAAVAAVYNAENILDTIEQEQTTDSGDTGKKWWQFWK